MPLKYVLYILTKYTCSLVFQQNSLIRTSFFRPVVGIYRQYIQKCKRFMLTTNFFEFGRLFPTKKVELQFPLKRIFEG